MGSTEISSSKEFKTKGTTWRCSRHPARPSPSPVLAASAASLAGVSKIYGGFAAVKNATLDLSAGSCTMILGENGAGKSTLLRLLAGLITPTRGTVSLFGGAPGEQRGRVAYMSHAPMLYDELSAMETSPTSPACSAQPAPATASPVRRWLSEPWVWTRTSRAPSDNTPRA